MPSHRHHSTLPPPPDHQPPYLVNHLGFRVPMDSTAMDEKLAVVSTHPEIEPYVAQTAEMAQQSIVWGAVSKGVMRTKGSMSTRLAVMYAYGFIVGSSCAVEAVDMGLITDSSNEYEEGDEG